MTTDQFLQLAGYVITGASGYASAEAIRWLRSRGERAADDAAEIRDELRKDKAELKDDLEKIRADYKELSLANARLEGQVRALSDENTKLRNENLTQKGENAALLAKLDIFEKLLAKLADNGPQQARGAEPA